MLNRRLDNTHNNHQVVLEIDNEEKSENDPLIENNPSDFFVIQVDDESIPIHDEVVINLPDEKDFEQKKFSYGHGTLPTDWLGDLSRNFYNDVLDVLLQNLNVNDFVQLAQVNSHSHSFFQPNFKKIELLNHFRDLLEIFRERIHQQNYDNAPYGYKTFYHVIKKLQDNCGVHPFFPISVTALASVAVIIELIFFITPHISPSYAALFEPQFALSMPLHFFLRLSLVDDQVERENKELSCISLLESTGGQLYTNDINCNTLHELMGPRFLNLCDDDRLVILDFLNDKLPDFDREDILYMSIADMFSLAWKQKIETIDANGGLMKWTP